MRLFSDGMRMIRATKSKGVRRFFKELHKLMVRVNEENATPQDRVALINSVGGRCSLEDTLGVVIVVVKPSDVLYYGKLMMRIINDNSLLNELLIGEAIGDYNFHIGRKKNRGVGIVVERGEWDAWMSEVVPLMLLLSKKQKMPDEDYLKCAKSVVRLMMEVMGRM